MTYTTVSPLNAILTLKYLYANVCNLLRMCIFVALDHLRDAIARWTVEEQGARQRALQGVFQLYRAVRIYFNCNDLSFLLYSLAVTSLAREGVAPQFTAVLFVLLVTFFEC